ncbi:MAG: 50S ribosomal protein L33 [Chlamydiia bacterium]|nr:50S ribosomal protein L33 [Chlamydiia bacterium]
MASKKREKITLRSSKSHHTYHTIKNKTNSPDRIELTKYDPVVREHVPYKESKK